MYDFINDAVFPVFRKFTANDFAPYKQVYEQTFAPYGDISPAGLFVWLNIDGTLEISRLDNALVLKYSNPFEQGEQNFILLESPVSEDHIRQIFELGSTEGYRVAMREQPFQGTMPMFTSIIATPNRDSFEYILDTAEHDTMPGKAYSRQRRRMGFFDRIHENDSLTYRFIDHPSETEKAQMHELLAKWQLVANEDQIASDNREFEALDFAIQSLDAFDRCCMIVECNGVPISFAIFSIYGDTAIISHIKVDYSVQYAFDYTTHIVAQELHNRGIPYMNFEQDLGIPGLREHKLRLRPVKMLEKYDYTLL